MNKTESPIPTHLLGSALWRRLDVISLEYFRLQGFSDGFILDGRVLTVFDDHPAEVHYAVSCDPEWVTRHVHVVVTRGARIRKLVLRRDAEGRWWRDDSEDVLDLSGVADVDLSITPATNTLPIRRLALDIGESAPTDAVWVRFPDLAIERLPQRYARTTDRSYHYESAGGAFAADIEVDQIGVVRRYGQLWERVAP